MITNDVLAGETNDFQKTIIERATEEHHITQEVFEDMLTEEEGHHDVFKTLPEI